MASGTIQKPNDKNLSVTFPNWYLLGMCNIDANAVRFIVQVPTLATGTYTGPTSFGAQITHCDNEFTDATFTVTSISRPSGSDFLAILTNRPSGVQSGTSGIFRFKENVTISVS